MKSSLTGFAKQLRKDATDAENRLWYHLQSKQFGGFKFRRQQPIENYIVDFICFERRLVVELDGSQHRLQAMKDQKRDKWLANRGYKVLRFWDNEIFENMDGVLEKIRTCLTPPPSPMSPPVEGGEKRYGF